MNLAPHYCAVCGKCFANEYFHTGGGGELIRFADFDDSAKHQGFVPGIVGAAWICSEHCSAARQRGTLTSVAAIHDIRASLGVRPSKASQRKQKPELFLVNVGMNRNKVFSILREKTEAPPEKVRNMMENVPAKIAEGWPKEFESCQRALVDVGAVVEIRWD